MRSMLCLFVLGFTGFVLAEDKKPAMPKGSWVRESDGINLRMTFGKDELKVTAKAGESTMNVTFKTEIDKEGLITATVSDVKLKGEFPETPKNGAVMKFKFKIDDKNAVLSAFESKDLEHAKAVLEGDYESKAD